MFCFYSFVSQEKLVIEKERAEAERARAELERERHRHERQRREREREREKEREHEKERGRQRLDYHRREIQEVPLRQQPSLRRVLDDCAQICFFLESHFCII